MSTQTLEKTRPIFISSATVDIEIARQLKYAIDQLPAFWGYIARDEPRTFEYPSEKIAQILEICSAYIILFTQSGLQSPMVNQEFGFFYNRYRTGHKNWPPILPLKSQNIPKEIDGFAYARESIPLDLYNPKDAICRVLWELKNTFSIKVLEIKCIDHIQRVNWPPIELVNKCIDTNTFLEFDCDICRKKIELDPYTFLRIK